MKMTFLVLSLIAFSAHAQYAKTGAIAKNVTAAGTPERVSSTDLYVSKAYVMGASTNTGIAFIGPTSDGAKAATGLTLPKPTATAFPNAIVLGSDKHGNKINLKEYWVDAATNGDDVIVHYIE